MSPVKANRLITLGAALAGLVVAMLALIGWWIDIPLLKSGFNLGRTASAASTMKPWTAVCIMLVSASLLVDQLTRNALRFRPLRLGFAAVAVVVTALSLLQYVAGLDLHFDTVLFRQGVQSEAVAHPGRMSIGTAVGLGLIGLALLFLDVGTIPRPTSVAAVSAVLVGASALCVYIHNTPVVREFLPFDTLAINTGVLVTVLGCACITARPDRGFVTTFNDTHLGGYLSRRVVPAAFAALFLLAYVRQLTQQAWNVPFEVGLAVFTLLIMVVLFAMLWLVASRLNHVDNRYRQTLAALRAEELRLKLATDGAGIGTWNYDPTADEVAYSPKARSLMGLTGNRLSTLEVGLGQVSPMDRDSVREQLRHCLATGEPYSRSFRINTATPDSVKATWLEAHAAVGPDAQLHGIVMDVTERQVAMMNAQRLSALVRSSSDAVLAKTMEGIITDWNQGAEQLFGYTADEMIGQDIARLYLGDDNGEERSIRSALRRGEVVTIDDTIRWTKDERPISVSVEAFPIRDEAGVTVGAATIIRDTSRKKQLEEMARSKAVAEESARAKDAFIAMMSHELRTPLNSILGFVGTLLMRLPGPLNDKQEHQLQTVRSSGRHLLAIINDLLDMARLDAGKISVDWQDVVVAEVMKSAVSTLKPAAEDAGLELRVGIEPSLAKSTVHTDRRLLLQMLLNLTSNAIKFTNAGHVSMTLNRSKRPGHLDLSVIDTGVGIAMSEIHAIFEPFHRIAPRATFSNGPTRSKLTANRNRSAGEGVGLGLHVCQRFAYLLDIDLSVTSQVNRGSCFTLSVPTEPLASLPPDRRLIE